MIKGCLVPKAAFYFLTQKITIMSLIRLVEKEEATGRVAEIYDTMINTMGFIPNAFKVFSPSEHVLSNQFGNLGYFMRHKTLGGKMLAFIRLLVSEQEQCRYCVGMNSGILLQYGVLPESLAEIKQEPSKAPLDEKELALLLFVLKVVKDSNSVEQGDVDKLKGLGWTEADIMDATYHGTTQVGVDKIFNAFKIDSEM
jgi:AhpD family alkylhydroperoxidase